MGPAPWQMYNYHRKGSIRKQAYSFGLRIKLLN